MLRLPDFELPFKVHTDASDKALGGVLVQKNHPVAYESRKLNDAEQKCSAHVGNDCCGSLFANLEGVSVRP